MKVGSSMHAFVEILLLNVSMTVDMNDADVLASDGRQTSDRRESNGMVSAKNNWHGALRSNVGHSIGYLVETFFNVCRNSENVANVAKSLWAIGIMEWLQMRRRSKYDELKYF